MKNKFHYILDEIFGHLGNFILFAPIIVFIFFVELFRLEELFDDKTIEKLP
ncbi:MAG: hypothetical protein IJI14_16200 [Anaerolineaceae bacterium]|nr:hypothetical protein [Anaerolineaceae bacterium]